MATSHWFCLAVVALVSADVGLPGERNYYVLLKSLGTSEGSLEPPFEPRGHKYKLLIENPETTEVVFTLQLKLEKYDLLHTPNITWDGKAKKYSPLNVIQIEVPMNKEIGPFDKTFKLVVSDPKGGIWSNSHSYSIHIDQPPDEKIVTAQNIIVTDKRGNTLEGTPKFSVNATTNTFKYVLPETAYGAYVEVVCPAKASGVAYNGVTREAGSPLWVSFAESATHQIHASCRYVSQRWTKGQLLEKTMIIHLQQNTDLQYMYFDLMILPGHGECHQNEILDAFKGFTCMTYRSEALFIADFNNTNAEVHLYNSHSKLKYILHSGLPIQVPVASSGELSISIEGGNQRRIIPLKTYRPQTCEGYQCPKLFALIQNPHQHFCIEPNCIAGSEQNNERCCEHVAMCDTYTIPYGYLPKLSDLSKIGCAATTCSWIDRHTCCDKAATCNTLSCAAEYVLKLNATSIACAGRACKATDLHTCCDGVGKCDSMHCSYPYVLKPSPWRFPCKEQVCTDWDLETCCDLTEMCTVMKCQAPTVLIYDAASTHCRTRHCSPSDSSLCCGKRAKCGSFLCPRGFCKNRFAVNRQCKGTVCTHVDKNTCCIPSAPCSTFKCPGDLVLRRHSKFEYCDRPKCKKTDTDNCCISPPPCALATCPPGHAPKLSALNLACKGDPCTEADAQSCCGRACSSMICPNKTRHIALASRIGYPSSHSEKDEIDTCCAPMGKCSSMTCQPKFALDPRAKLMDCANNADCLEDDRDYCCVNAPTCETFKCPPYWVHKETASRTYCAQSSCTGLDVLACCEERDSCTPEVCKGAYYPRKDIYKLLCAGKTCVEADMAICCKSNITGLGPTAHKEQLEGMDMYMDIIVEDASGVGECTLAQRGFECSSSQSSMDLVITYMIVPLSGGQQEKKHRVVLRQLPVPSTMWYKKHFTVVVRAAPKGSMIEVRTKVNIWIGRVEGGHVEGRRLQVRALPATSFPKYEGRDADTADIEWEDTPFFNDEM